MATSADPDSSSKIQLELPFVSLHPKERELRALIGDPSVREWIAGLWSRHQPLLLELAHFHLHDWDKAQEVVQDMWVDVLKSLHRFEGRCSAKTWLVQILRRCIQKEQRRTIFRRAREVLIGGVGTGPHEHSGRRVNSQANWHDTPEQMLLAQERLEKIMRARRSLPVRQAEVWILRDVYQWTSKEVAVSLGLTAENQRVLLHRARQRLKAELRGYFGDAEAVQSGPTKSHDLQRS